MSVYNLILKRRTIRKFKQKSISEDLLKKMINAARLSPSGANLQPLEFIVINQMEMLENVFSTTRWAAYLSPKGTPQKGERPVAYVVVLINRTIKANGGEHDCGAAIMNMILTALEQDVGSCWIGSIERDKLRTILSIPSNFDIDSILALGYPSEGPVVEEYKDSVKYWKDDDGELHVPKRNIENLIHWNRF